MFKTLRILENEAFLKSISCSKTLKSRGYVLYKVWTTILIINLD